jgi:hypothetical protein
MCPPPMKIVRVAVDRAEPTWSFRDQELFIHHAGSLNETLPRNVQTEDVTSIVWGCATAGSLRSFCR